MVAKHSLRPWPARRGPGASRRCLLGRAGAASFPGCPLRRDLAKNLEQRDAVQLRGLLEVENKVVSIRSAASQNRELGSHGMTKLNAGTFGLKQAPRSASCTWWGIPLHCVLSPWTDSHRSHKVGKHRALIGGCVTISRWETFIR